jgi:predicted histidine transporter YuiF (NhaC family)
MMSKTQVVVLIAGLLLVALCAFFPPRRYMPTQTADSFSTRWDMPARISVLSPDIYKVQGGGWLCIDVSRLLAECLVIGALTGAVFFLLRLGRRRDNS